MQFRMIHTNINVTDLQKSAEFYQKALGLNECRRKEAEDGSFILLYLHDGVSGNQLELTWLADKQGRYELGDNETHIAFETEDLEAARKLHREMDVAAYLGVRRDSLEELRVRVLGVRRHEAQPEVPVELRELFE